VEVEKWEALNERTTFSTECLVRALTTATAGPTFTYLQLRPSLANKVYSTA